MKNKKGFTLTELLAVIAIIGILALVGVTTTKKVMEQGKKKVFVSSLKEALTSATRYGDDNKKEIENSASTIKIDDVDIKYVEKTIGDLIENNYEKTPSESFKHYETDEDVKDIKIIVYENNGRITSCIPYEDNKDLLKDTDKSKFGDEGLYCDIKVSGNNEPNPTTDHEPTPQITIELKSVDNQDDWTQSKTIKYTITDEGNISYKYSIKKDTCDGINWDKKQSSIGDVKTANESITGTSTIREEVGENGVTYSLCVYYEEKLVSANISVKKIDRTSPSLSGNVKKEGNNITYKLTDIKDEGTYQSGVKYVCVTTSTNSSSCTWEDYNIHEGKIDIDSTKYYGFAKDAVGNVSSARLLNLEEYVECSQKIRYSTETSCNNGTKQITYQYKDSITGNPCGIEQINENCKSCTDWKAYYCTNDGYQYEYRTCYDGTKGTNEFRENRNIFCKGSYYDCTESDECQYCSNGSGMKLQTCKYKYGGYEQDPDESWVDCTCSTNKCSQTHLVPFMYGECSASYGWGTQTNWYIKASNYDNSTCDVISKDEECFGGSITPIYKDDPEPEPERPEVCDYLDEMIDNSKGWLDGTIRQAVAHDNNLYLEYYIERHFDLDIEYDRYTGYESGYWYLDNREYPNCYLLYSIYDAYPQSKYYIYPSSYEAYVAYRLTKNGKSAPCTYYRNYCK